MGKTQTFKILPAADRLVVEKREADDKTEGGILLPTGAQEVPLEGTVVVVGPDVEAYAEGDLVFFTAYAGSEISLRGEVVFVLREDDIMGKIEEK